MSRCFPFPPPGYENEARTDHVDLLTKEKHKEKKHKKEKREKEKREGKEKDGSKDKHKEKKDRKEKHKDNKKDKDRDKDKSRTSDDRRHEDRIDGHHKVKLGESSQRAADVKDSKFTDLGSRLRDEEKDSTNTMVENFTPSIHRRIEGLDASAGLEMEGAAAKETVPNSVRISQKRNDGIGRQPDNFAGSIQKSEGMGKATAMEKERLSTEKRRNHGMGRAMDNCISSTQEKVEGMHTFTASEKERTANNNVVPNPIARISPNLIITEQRRNLGVGRTVDNPVVPRRVVGTLKGSALEKERGKSNNMGIDAMGCPMENLTFSIQKPKSGTGTASATEKERGNGSKMVPKLIVMEKRSDGMGGSTPNTENSIERKEKKHDGSTPNTENSIKRKEKKHDGSTPNTENSIERKEKHGDIDRTEKKKKGKDKDGHKEKEKEEKIRQKGELKHKKEHDKASDCGKKDMIRSPNVNHSAPDGNIKKRKDSETNGFLHEDDARPNKFMKTSSSSRPCLENGRMLEACHIAAPSVSHGTMNNIRVGVLDNKGHKVNGIAEPRFSSVELKPPVALGTSESGVPLKVKPPHPDSKYLSQIYSVPKMEELLESDEQEWLFSSDSLRPKPKTKSDAEETTQVWAEALQIESVDVMAFPYVIPF